MERFSLAGSGGGDRAAADRLAALDAHLAQLQAQQKARAAAVKLLLVSICETSSHQRHLMLRHVVIAACVSTLAAAQPCCQHQVVAHEREM